MPKILICISGSIAAVKLPLLIHQLSKKGYECRVIITCDGLNFVTPMAISSMGADVYLDSTMDTTSYAKVMQHIYLGKWADYIIICPASANTLAKLVTGSADNLLSSTVLASNASKIVVPAMNQLMWKNSLVQKNVSTLIEHGFIFWGPVSGLQACGDDDIGRMIEIDEIIDRINSLIDKTTKSLFGKHIVITAGGTREAIDPVRYISNNSSGKMAYAIAEEAIKLGAEVSLISSTNLEAPNKASVTAVTSSEEMLDSALALSKNADIFIGCAAVCDYKVKTYNSQKIKKAQTMKLDLIPTPDILKAVRNKYPNLYIVGFAAETDNIIEYAKAKLVDKRLDMIVANDVSNNQVFNQDTNQVSILNKDFTRLDSIKTSKKEIAGFILDNIVQQHSLGVN